MIFLLLISDEKIRKQNYNSAFVQKALVSSVVTMCAANLVYIIGNRFKIKLVLFISCFKYSED